MTFEVMMLPTPKGRPRFANGHAFTPQRTRDAEQLIAWTAKQAGVPFHSGPVSLTVECWFKMPTAWSEKKKKQFNGQPRQQRPDVDNLLKIMDSLNGVAWEDDAQVTTATISKLHGTENKLTITINGL